MASFDDGQLSHYHRLSDSVYMSMVSFCRSLVSHRVRTGRATKNVHLTDDFCNLLLRFLDEMQFMYIHPRSTSARISFMNCNHTANPSRK